MGTLKLSLPDELEKTMKQFKVDWSTVAVKAIADKAEKLRRLKQLTAGIKVSEKAAKEFTDMISENVARRYREAK